MTLFRQLVPRPRAAGSPRRKPGGYDPSPVWMLAAIAAALLPAGVAAQAVVPVEGLVLLEGGGAIEGALVELEGLTPTMTDPLGAFRFEDVPAGPRRIRVTAFGYLTRTDTVDIRADQPLRVVLDAAPFRLDSLIVSARRMELQGRVRDPEREVDVVGAEIWTGFGEATESGGAGRFEVEAWEGVPVRILVRAFRYLPLDTVVNPGGERITLVLEEDPLVARMLSVEVERLDERAGGRMAVGMRPLGREELDRWRGAPLDEVLRFEFPRRSRRVRCVVLDEQALMPMAAEGVLLTLPAREVERMEFLFDGAMLRIYTANFMRRMLGRGLELRQPVYVDQSRPPFCA
jgi:hypothetical protein